MGNLRYCLLLALVVGVVRGSQITFDDGGSLGIRPGCPLDKLGETTLIYPKHEAPCGDQEDQDDWDKAIGVWQAAGDTWVNTCTAQKTQAMAKGCPQVPVAKVLKNDTPWESEQNAWVTHYGPETTTFSGINKGVWNTALFDLRASKFIFGPGSIIQYINGFLYVVDGGILKLNNAHVYSEDNADSDLGAAVIAVNAKIGCLNGSEFVQQDSTLAFKNSKFWLEGSFVKQLGGAFIIQNTTWVSTDSEVQFWGIEQAHIARSVLNFTNTQVTLRKTFLKIWDTTIILSGTSALNLKDGSRILLSNVKIVGDSHVKATQNIPDGIGVTVNQPLDSMNIDFKFEGETPTEADMQTITLGVEEKAAADNGR